MNTRLRLFLSILCCTAAAPVHAAGVTAGSLIESTANASYDTAGGRSTVSSNRVSLRVDEVIDATLTSLDSQPVAMVGGSSVLTFSLSNQGNGPEAFRLSTNPVAGSAFDPVVGSLAVDTNGNGIFDSGIDQVIQPGAATPELASGASLVVFVVATPSAAAEDGDEGRISLLAQAVTGTGTPGTAFAGQGATGVDAIIGANGGRATANGTFVIRTGTVSVTKTFVISDPFGTNEPVPGAFVTFSLAIQVLGSGGVGNLVINDPIPEGTRYIPATLTLDDVALSDAADADTGSFDSSGITVQLGDLPGGASRNISFRVQVE